MFIWKVKGSRLRYEIWSERKKPFESKNIEKAFPSTKDAHASFEFLVATNAPLTIEIHEQIRNQLLGRDGDPFGHELEVESVHCLGWCEPPLLDGKKEEKGE